MISLRARKWLNSASTLFSLSVLTVSKYPCSKVFNNNWKEQKKDGVQLEEQLL